MATSSFERPFNIQDDDTGMAMVEAMEKPNAEDHTCKSNL
jgi:hypothetical protein